MKDLETSSDPWTVTTFSFLLFVLGVNPQRPLSNAKEGLTNLVRWNPRPRCWDCAHPARRGRSFSTTDLPSPPIVPEKASFLSGVAVRPPKKTWQYSQKPFHYSANRGNNSSRNSCSILELDEKPRMRFPSDEMNGSVNSVLWERNSTTGWNKHELLRCRQEIATSQLQIVTQFHLHSQTANSESILRLDGGSAGKGTSEIYEIPQTRNYHFGCNTASVRCSRLRH